MHQSSLLLWIVLFPLFGAVANGMLAMFAGRPLSPTDRTLVKGVGVGVIALAFFTALVSFMKMKNLHGEGEHAAGALAYTFYEWFTLTLPSGLRLPVNVGFVMDHLSGVMTLVVTGIGTLIHIYSAGYMDEEPSIARFFCYLNLFTASMLVLVLGSNFPVLFVGWEGVGVCSYLLIGFWFENPAYAAAGKKAFIVNRIGDFGVIAGMLLLAATAGSFEFTDIIENAGKLGGAADFGLVARYLPGAASWLSQHQAWVPTVATAACLFLFLGCTGKSAQLPLYVWLPDAMAGPTPVSALIHAATMVTAGVYLCCRMSPIFVMSPAALSTIAIVGTLTAFIAASIGLVQNQLKKVLAYSTVSQLGFMFAAVGVGAFTSGFFHVFTHAFFKACLFLGAGSVMHAVHAHGDADVRKLGGLKKYMPVTHATFLVSCLAIAGVPPFAGFFSKDAILDGALQVGEFTAIPGLGYVIFALLVITAAMTAFYMFRLYFLTFLGPEKWRGGHADEHGDDHAHGADASQGDDDHGHHVAEPHESPASITFPLVVLAIGAVVVGFLGMPHWWGEHANLWDHWLAPVVASIPAGEHGMSHTTAGVIAMVSGLAAAVAGIGAAFVIYIQQHGAPAKSLASSMTGLYKLLLDKWRVDELYEATVVRGMRAISFISAETDRILVDGLLTKLTAFSVRALGWAFTRLQTGGVYAYGLSMVLGLLVLAWWFLFPHPTVETRVDANSVTWKTSPGLGYAFRWDTNDDGEADTEWSAELESQRTYEPQDYAGAVLVFQTAGHRPGARMVDSTGRSEAPDELIVEAEPVAIDEDLLGRDWHDAKKPELPPAASWDDCRAAAAAHGGNHDAEHAAADCVPGLVLRFNGARVDGTDKTRRVAIGQTFTFGNGTTVRVGGLVRGVLEARNVFGNESRELVEVRVRNPGGNAEPTAQVTGDLGGQP